MHSKIKITIQIISCITTLLILITSCSASELKLKAMCYGPGLYGNKTANGTKLQRSTEGIAHRKWQFGKEVTLKYKDQYTQTKVIDRGPYTKGVELDITEATAKKLGFKDCSDFGVRTLTVVEKIKEPLPHPLSSTKRGE